MKELLLVVLGGGFGSAGRYLLSGYIAKMTPKLGAVSYGTIGVNVIGSFVMGILFGYFMGRDNVGGIRIFLMVGVLGGFTTFSSFSVEMLQMLKAGDVLSACLYVGGSVLGGLIACGLGYWLVRN